MSEYQYYEFVAVERALTKGQLGEVRKVSSRARLSATGFVNEYEWGDFKGDPVEFLGEVLRCACVLGELAHAAGDAGSGCGIGG